MLELNIVVGVEWSDGAGAGAESGAYDDDASWASVESGNLMLLLLQ